MQAILQWDACGGRECEIEIGAVIPVGSRIRIWADSIPDCPDVVSVQEELVILGYGWDTKTGKLIIACCEEDKHPNGPAPDNPVYFD